MSHHSYSDNVRALTLCTLRVNRVRAERYHGLDWLRAIAALLVVMLHAGLAYTLTPWPGLAWPVHQANPGSLVDAVTWWIDGFIMPLFFVLGGFFAAHLFLQRGAKGFLGHRVRRVLLPFLFGCVVILPLDLYVWLLGWVVEDRIPLRKLRSLKLGDAGRDLWGVGHLWFLQYLFLFCVVMWAVQHAWDMWHAVRAARGKMKFPRTRIDRISETRAGALLAPLICALPCALALWWEPRIVLGFRHSWHPLAANLLYYAPCFIFGWWKLHRHRSGDRVGRYAGWHLAASIAAFAVLLPMAREHVATELTGNRRIALCLLFASFAWLSSVGWFGLFLNHLGKPPKPVAYVAESSFWMYLFHHPVVGLAQVSLAGAALPVWGKYCLSAGAAVCLSLLTYEVLVRRTWVGLLLNGRTESRTAGREADIISLPQPGEADVPVPHRRAA